MLFRLIPALLSLAAALNALSYPATEQIPHTDRYHGVDVSDPFAWLERGSSSNVRKWELKQSRLFDNYLKQTNHHDILLEEIKKYFLETESYTIQLGASNRLLTFYQDPDQHSPQIYIQQEAEGPFELLLDINTWESEATFSFFEVSPDGRYLALGVQERGNERPSLLLFDAETMAACTDTVMGQRHSCICWNSDSSGFYYAAHPAKGKVSEDEEYFWEAVYYHQLGTTGNKDFKILADKKVKDWSYQLFSDDKDLYIARSRLDERAHVILEYFYKPLDNPKIKPEKILTTSNTDLFEQELSIGGDEYLLTDKDAPHFCLKRKNADGQWSSCVDENEDIIQEVCGLGHSLAIVYRCHGHDRVSLYSPFGEFLHEMPLPGPGTVFLSADWDSEQAVVIYSSLSQPPVFYSYDVSTNALTTIQESPVPDYNPGDYITTQVFARSADGTMIPMHIAHHKDVREGPVLLTAYGGFGISYPPAFDYINLPWLKNKGIVCVAHIRGGGEYGEAWHLAAVRKKRTRSFDDFIAAAEYLTETMTTPEQLAVWGGSNGGLLTGAAVVRRPDLFGAAVSSVPLLDMLRYHHFRLGFLWKGEYGCSANKNEFPALLAYSPYHNTIKGVNYPATLITTGLHDLRCDPMHARKMTARLQADDPNGKPHLLKINYNGGHQDHSRLVLAHRIAQEHGFLMREINMGLQGHGLQKKGMGKMLFFARLMQDQQQDNYREKVRNETILRRCLKIMERKEIHKPLKIRQ